MIRYLSIFVLISCSVFSLFSCRPEPKQGNSTLDTIFNRKSVRKYTERPVEKEMLETLARAGMAAPSSKDRRPWEFIIVTDQKLLDAMVSLRPSTYFKSRIPVRSLHKKR